MGKTANSKDYNSIWVRILPGPMHLGLKTGPFETQHMAKLMENLAIQTGKLASLELSSYIFNPSESQERIRTFPQTRV